MEAPYGKAREGSETDVSRFKRPKNREVVPDAGEDVTPYRVSLSSASASYCYAHKRGPLVVGEHVVTVRVETIRVFEAEEKKAAGAVPD